MSDLFSFGLGTSTRNAADDILDTWYPLPLKQPEGAIADAAKRIGNQDRAGPGEATLAADALEAGGQPIAASTYRMLAELDQPLTAVLLEADEDIASAPQAYLKLHLLSHRLVKPHGVSLAGIFPLLPNVAWTNIGAVDLAELAELAGPAEDEPAAADAVSAGGG